MIDDFGDLDELYQQVILDHSRHPRNFRAMENADGRADGYNPLCGDRVTVFVDLDNGSIADASFVGKGCAICTAAASMMTQALKGQPRDDAERTFQRFHQMLTSDDPAAMEELGKLAVFAGVKKYPIRVKCATLPWHTFKAALDHKDEPVTTE